MAWTAGPLAGAAPGAAATIAIGVELPLAGDDGAAGLEARSAIELALDEHDAHRRSGAPVLRALVRDAALHLANPHQDEGTNNAAEPARAAVLMHEFAGDANVVAVLGGLRANVAAVEGAAAAAMHVPLLTIASLPLPCPPHDVPPGGPSAFSLDGGAPLEALATVRSLEVRGRRFAVIDDGEDGRGLVAACVSAALQREGARAVLRLSVLPGRFESSLDAIRAGQRRAAVETVIYVAPLERGTLVCSEPVAESIERAETLAEMTHRGYDPATIPSGCRWVVRRLPPRSAAYAAFVQRYRQRFLEAPSDEASTAYAATQVLTQAFDAAETASPRNLREGLRAALAGDTFETVLGPVRFAAAGGAASAWYGTGNSSTPFPIAPTP